MSDIRERHVPARGITHSGERVELVCSFDARSWPCDTAIVLAQLDKAEAALAECREWTKTLETRIASWRKSHKDARADAKALAEALDLYPRDFHRQAHDTTVDWRDCPQPSCAASSAAFAAHKEATR